MRGVSGDSEVVTLRRRRRCGARPTPRSASGSTGCAAALESLGVERRATGSRRSCGTRRSTSRSTSACPAWAPCCTRSTSGCSPSSSPTSPTTPRTRSCSSTTRSCRCSRRWRRRFETVEHYVVVGDGDAGLAAERGPLRGAARRAAADGYDYPELDERTAAGLCYTSGTTGNPKGVLYSHRSNVLHSMGTCIADDARRHALVRPRAAGRADVPRERLGPPVRVRRWSARTW